MPSLMELVDRVNRGEIIDAEQLEVYQDSPNSAEKFLAHHAQAMLDLRKAHQHLAQSLEAIDYADQKVLGQFMSISGFLNLTDLRAGPVVKFGASAINRREYALGIEAIQNAVAFDLAQSGAYTTDRENCQFIAQQYGRVAQSTGWSNPSPSTGSNKITRIGYIVSGIADDDAAARTLRGLAKFIDQKRFKLHVYITEAGVRHDKQQFAQNTYVPASSRRGSSTLETLATNKVSNVCASVDGDLLKSATDLANSMAKDKIDLAIFDCTQADPIAAILADWEIARVKINFCRSTPLYAAGISCINYLDAAKYEADAETWKNAGITSRYMLEGLDLTETLPAAPQRSVYGIPEQAIVMATSSSDLNASLSNEFVDSVIHILRAHPHAVYLPIGEGDLGWQKRKFESAGVAKRVGYAGKRKDLPGFLRMADIYLAEFPHTNSQGVLFAMAMGKPVVAMGSPEQSQAVSFIGGDAGSPIRDSAGYIERVSQLIREPVRRGKLGQSMRSRAEQHFSFEQTTRQIEQLCDQLLQPATSSEGSVTMEEPSKVKVA